MPHGTLFAIKTRNDLLGERLFHRLLGHFIGPDMNRDTETDIAPAESNAVAPPTRVVAGLNRNRRTVDQILLGSIAEVFQILLWFEVSHAFSGTAEF